MDDEGEKPEAVDAAEAVLLDPGERPTGLLTPGGPAGAEGTAAETVEGRDVTESVEQPAKVMRIGSMVKQLLDEVRAAGLDEASRTRLREIYELSVQELAGALSPDLAAELDRMTLPFDDSVPSEAELRIAQAQLVGWLEGLFHGIQATLLAQQMAARAQLEEMRQRGLPPGMGGQDSLPARPGTYL
ncbi:MAG: bacterial proteasome activator family protein [Candidatus Sulfotelmatobacter sp.]